MRWSKFFIPTAKATPADPPVASHRLSLRAGLIRQVATGSFTYLPLGLRVLGKIEAILREELEAVGAIELSMPALQPLAWWEQTGRLVDAGERLLALKGQDWQQSVVLTGTSEQAITDLARGCVSSYKQLPLIFFQIRTVLRDDARPRNGLLRAREGVVMAAYSLDADSDGLRVSYRNICEAYQRVFARCGLAGLLVEAVPEVIGEEAHEFVVSADAGEEVVAVAEDGSYAANTKCSARAVPQVPLDPPPSAMQPLEEVYTPNCPGIDDVCAFLKVQPHQLIKTMVYQLSGENGHEKSGRRPARARYVIACVRGDHEVNENKLRMLCGGAIPMLCDVAAAQADGFIIGYVGPHLVNSKGCLLLIDADARAVVNGVAGANQQDHHVKGFNWIRDVDPERLSKAVIGDLRRVVEGDLAPSGGGSPLHLRAAIKAAGLVQLGTTYSVAMQATFLDQHGQARQLVMGRYEIALERFLAAVIETHHDDNGICWPMSMAPFEVVIVTLDLNDEQVMSASRGIHDELTARGIEVLWDDRDQRAGFKFKDADLIGVPIRVTVSRKVLEQGSIEVKMRVGGEVELVPIHAVVEEVARRVGRGRTGH